VVIGVGAERRLVRMAPLVHGATDDGHELDPPGARTFLPDGSEGGLEVLHPRLLARQFPAPRLVDDSIGGVCILDARSREGHVVDASERRWAPGITTGLGVLHYVTIVREAALPPVAELGAEGG